MPDPLAPLFEALESINNELTAFAARLARLENSGSIPGGSRKDGGDAAGAVEGHRVAGAPVVWHRIEDEEVRAALWAEFTSWVIQMADTYELTTEQLPHSCWWEHGSVVAELTALWTGWESSYGNEEDAAAGPYLWHDAWSRAVERIGRMWLGECTNGYHQQKSRTMWGTDPAYRQKVLQAGAPGGRSAPVPKAA
ncbi:hypothetical protein ACWGRF_03740 [Streptomyces zhihengii]|uniref:DUF4913 domain-containing protein n=1 Tax=Streptomyces zhihengii TaxID=1818004 RepID=A0ABS2V280_9ACTN|nr:hypothetical protein [Streptomyces zhihengii]MBM9623947.1 hypothetical protein [Streptomyces zhihengii]